MTSTEALAATVVTTLTFVSAMVLGTSASGALPTGLISRVISTLLVLGLIVVVVILGDGRGPA